MTARTFDPYAQFINPYSEEVYQSLKSFHVLMLSLSCCHLEWDPIWKTPAQESHALRLRYQCCLRISDISAYGPIGPITGLSPRHKKLARRGLTSQATFWSESQMDHVINSTSNSGPDHQSWLHYNMVHIPWITLCTLSPKLWLKHSKWGIKDSTCLVINRACLGVATSSGVAELQDWSELRPSAFCEGLAW